MTDQDSCAKCKHAVPRDTEGIDFECQNDEVLEMFGLDNSVTVAGHFCCRGFHSKQPEPEQEPAKPIKMDFE